MNVKKLLPILKERIPFIKWEIYNNKLKDGATDVYMGDGGPIIKGIAATDVPGAYIYVAIENNLIVSNLENKALSLEEFIIKFKNAFVKAIELDPLEYIHDKNNKIILYIKEFSITTNNQEDLFIIFKKYRNELKKFYSKYYKSMKINKLNIKKFNLTPDVYKLDAKIEGELK